MLAPQRSFTFRTAIAVIAILRLALAFTARQSMGPGT